MGPDFFLTDMKSIVSQHLTNFLNARKDRFSVPIPADQFERWSQNVESAIMAQLEDNDIFYDNMPEDVEEK